MPKWVVPRQSTCFRGPMEERYYYWIFRGLAHKSRAKKIRYLQLPLFYLISRVQWEVSNKERNSAFCCPKIACGNYVVHGLRLILPDKAELLQLVRRNLLTWPLKMGKKLWFFFFGQKVSTLTRSTLTGGHTMCAGKTQRPHKVRRAAQSIQGPINGSRGFVLTISTPFL